MIALDRPGTLNDASISHFYEDAIRIESGDTEVIGIQGRDTLPEQLPELRHKAHRDYIQLLPRVPGAHNQQYCGAELSNITIRDCRFYSPNTQCQGIFASDGFYRGVNIFLNQISVGSQHKITLNGLHSGWIAGNTDQSGALVPVVLNPLRLLGGFNVWVIGFRDCVDECQPIDDIVHDEALDHVTDNRRLITRPRDMYLTDFDLAAFRADAMAVNAPDANALCAELHSHIEDYGTRVYAA